MSVKLPEITPLFSDIRTLIDSARQTAVTGKIDVRNWQPSRNWGGIE